MSTDAATAHRPDGLSVRGAVLAALLGLVLVQARGPADATTALLPLRLPLLAAARAAEAVLLCLPTAVALTRMRSGEQDSRRGLAIAFACAAIAGWLVTGGGAWALTHPPGVQFALELAWVPALLLFLWAVWRAASSLAGPWVRTSGRGGGLRALLRDAALPSLALFVALSTDYHRFALWSEPVRFYLVAIVAVAASLVAASRLASSALPLLRGAALAALAGIAAVLLWFDATQYVRLYDAMHLAAWIGSTFAGARLVGALRESRASARPLTACAAATLMLLAPLLDSALRHELLERSAAVGRLFAVLGLRAGHLFLPEPPPSEAILPAADAVAPRPGARPDILVISVDALRNDRVSPARMPRLSEFARAGTRFEEARTPHPGTHRTLDAVTSGRFPPLRTPRTRDRPSLLWRALAAQGYRTTFVTAFAATVHHAAGADEVVSIPARNDDALTERIVRLLGEDHGPRDAPRFWWVHLDAPHSPYVHAGDSSGKGVAAYDACVAETDVRLGRILDAVRSRPAGRGTITVVFSDHGEEFGDHGGQFHGRTGYEELNRVPLLFVGPGIEAQSRPGAAWLVDLAPTLLDLAGAGVPAGLHGRSLVGALRGGALPERTLLIEVPEEEGPLRLRAAVRGRWKLIANYRSGTLELYDLAADPLERANRLDLLARAPAELRAAIGLDARTR